LLKKIVERLIYINYGNLLLKNDLNGLLNNMEETNLAKNIDNIKQVLKKLRASVFSMFVRTHTTTKKCVYNTLYENFNNDDDDNVSENSAIFSDDYAGENEETFNDDNASENEEDNNILYCFEFITRLLPDSDEDNISYDDMFDTKTFKDHEESKQIYGKIKENLS
jgi:hypothetical protein